MERFKQLSGFQKFVLITLALMALVFSVLYFVTIRREGFAYLDGLLMRSEENGDTLWSGAVEGRMAVFTVHPDKTVEYRWGDKHYGPYTVKEDPTAVPKNHGMSGSMKGVEVYRGGTRIFRGGLLRQYSEKDYYSLYNEDGSPEIAISIGGQDGTVTVDGNGNVIDVGEPSASTIIQLIYGPALWHYGDGMFLLMGLFGSVILALSVFFWEDMFRWNVRRSFRNAEGVEPSDLTLTLRSLSWCISLIAVLLIFLTGLRQMV